MLFIATGLLTIFYFRIRFKFSYFRSRGIAEDPGYFPLGSTTVWKLLTGKLAVSQMLDDAYKKFPNEKVSKSILQRVMLEILSTSYNQTGCVKCSRISCFLQA